MRKTILLLLCLLLLLAPAGCGSGGASGGRNGGPSTNVSDVLEQGMAGSDDGGSPAESAGVPDLPDPDEQTAGAPDLPAETGPEPDASPDPEGQADGIDVDLTVLSSTMVYSEVYNMMTVPEEYLGRTVKMQGLFAIYCDEATGNLYFACLVQDATACCAQGIEFILSDGRVYPDDYPEAGEEICVVGVFDTYQEGPYTYCTLRNAHLL